MNVFFAGDICLEHVVDSELLSTELKKIIHNCDITFVNFEGAAPKKKGSSFEKKAGPSISQNYKNIELLSKEGINLFGLANNHIMDCGITGLTDTIAEVKRNGRAVVGAGKCQKEAYSVFRYKGDCNVSIIAVAENSFGCIKNSESGFAWMNDYRVQDAIKKEKCDSDYVLVTCHCGAELFDKPLPEVRNMYKHFIDLGADAVIGHHPHVCQGIEEYRGRPIFYSLGNFAFDNFGSYPDTIRYVGMVIVLKLSNLDSKLEYEAFPVSYHYGKIKICDRIDFNKWLDFQREVLDDSQTYMKSVNDFCLRMYDEVYEAYILRGCGLFFHSLKSKLGSIYRELTGSRHSDTYLQWHNFAVETNRWIIERALSIKNNLGK